MAACTPLPLLTCLLLACGLLVSVADEVSAVSRRPPRQQSDDCAAASKEWQHLLKHAAALRMQPRGEQSRDVGRSMQGGTVAAGVKRPSMPTCIRRWYDIGRAVTCATPEVFVTALVYISGACCTDCPLDVRLCGPDLHTSGAIFTVDLLFLRAAELVQLCGCAGAVHTGDGRCLSAQMLPCCCGLPPTAALFATCRAGAAMCDHPPEAHTRRRWAAAPAWNEF